MVAREGKASVGAESTPRTYQVRTYGCQMNVHDSERLAGLLDAAGYVAAEEGADATSWCSTRARCARTPTTSSTATSATSRPRRSADPPNMQIAVGGCLAQKDRDAVLTKAPWVDVVFGTHNIGSLPVLLERARHQRAAQVEIAEVLQEFPPSALPASRESLTRHGFPSRWGATTRARSASSRHCAAKRSTAGPAISWPKCRHWSTRGGARDHPAGPERQRLRCVVRRPRHSAQPRCVRRSAARMRAYRGPRTRAVHLPRTRPNSPMT